MKPRPLSPDIDVQPVMQVSADVALRQERGPGHGGVVRRALGGAAAVAHRDHPHRLRGRRPAHRPHARQGRVPHRRTAACRWRAPCAWTSPWPTSPSGRTWSTGTEAILLGDDPARLGPRGPGRAPPRGRSSPASAPACRGSTSPAAGSCAWSRGTCPEVARTGTDADGGAPWGPMATSAKVKTVFGCQACGFESSKWLGRCPDCGEWNSFVEERAGGARRRRRAARRRDRRPAASPTT